MKLHAMIEHLAKSMRVAFAASGQVYPMYHYITDQGQHKIFTVPMLPDKDFVAALVRQVLAEDHAVKVLSVYEVWSFDPVDKADAYKWIGRISEHPDRFEMIYIIAESLTEPSLCGSIRINRNPDGSGILGPLQIIESNQAEGRFVGLLPYGVKH